MILFNFQNKPSRMDGFESSTKTTAELLQRRMVEVARERLPSIPVVQLLTRN